MVICKLIMKQIEFEVDKIICTLQFEVDKMKHLYYLKRLINLKLHQAII